MRFNEPTYLKYVKLKIISAVANVDNMAETVDELKEVVCRCTRDTEEELARRGIRAVAAIASRVPAAAPGIIDQLLEFLDLDLDQIWT